MNSVDSLKLIGKIAKLKNGKQSEIVSTINSFTSKGMEVTSVGTADLGEVNMSDIDSIE